ncbi:MAG TPA: transaldolase [Acidimicrobiales bacterium]|nr:transaldolase [Acidimicrobiales bacterium]
MNNLQKLCVEQGQSPWLDNLNRPAIIGGGLQKLVDSGIRGVTSNPTIFQKAMTGSDAYDDQFRRLIERDSVEAAFWDMAVQDVTDACGILRPVHDAAGGTDGFVSLEVAPNLANQTDPTIEAARNLHERIALPNLMVKIPATEEGVPAIRKMISEGRNINVTLIFSLPRYEAVMEAYISGLEALAESGGDLGQVHSVASFFVSRVDTEVDRRLEKAGADPTLSGRAAVAQAKIAYELFQKNFSGPRWEALASAGAHVQRPLWASTSTKNPAYPDLLYVDNLIGPHTVNTLPDKTIEAFLDHGTPACTVETGVDEAHRLLEQELPDAGIDMDSVSRTLEQEGVASFVKSWDELVQSLSDKANALAGERH